MRTQTYLFWVHEDWNRWDGGGVVHTGLPPRCCRLGSGCTPSRDSRLPDTDLATFVMVALDSISAVQDKVILLTVMESRIIPLHSRDKYATSKLLYTGDCAFDPPIAVAIHTHYTKKLIANPSQTLSPQQWTPILRNPFPPSPPI
jgi:hypothetical protein